MKTTLILLSTLAALAADPSPSSPREGFIQVEGGPVWFRIFGEGKETPLLMVHGGPGGRSCTFEPLAEILGQERPVILYDQLGSGRSGRPTERNLWTVNRFVRELGQVRTTLGLTNVHLLVRPFLGSGLGYFLPEFSRLRRNSVRRLAWSRRSGLKTPSCS